MIFDFHTHNFRKTVPETVIALENTADSFLCLGDVFAFGADPSAEEIHKINDDVLEYTSCDPAHRFAACFINPCNSVDSCIREMRFRVLEQGFKAIKFEVNLPCSDPAMTPLMREIARLKVPVVHHCWRKSTDRCPGESFPEDVVVLAKRNPDVNIVMAHISSCGYLGVAQIAPLKNVYTDTSGGVPEGSILEYALALLGPERILYGSDVPCRSAASQLGRVLGCVKSPRARDLILHKNAERLLGL